MSFQIKLTMQKRSHIVQCRQMIKQRQEAHQLPIILLMRGSKIRINWNSVSNLQTEHVWTIVHNHGPGEIPSQHPQIFQEGSLITDTMLPKQPPTTKPHQIQKTISVNPFARSVNDNLKLFRSYNIQKFFFFNKIFFCFLLFPKIKPAAKN